MDDNAEILERVNYGDASKQDINVARHIHNTESWVTAPVARALLCSEIFNSFAPDISTRPMMAKDVINSQILLIRHIEDFRLRTIQKEISEQVPALLQ